MPWKLQPEDGVVFDVNVVSGGAGGGGGNALTDAQLRANPVSVTISNLNQPVTDAQMRATPLPVALASVPSHPVTGPLTDAQLRATAVPVSGTVGVSGTVPVSGPVTDTQLRASAVPVSLASVPTHGVTGPLTDAQLRASAVPVSGTVAVSGTLPVSGPATDAQLRATPLPVSGTVTATGPLTDAQLRASSVPVSTGLTQPFTDAQNRAMAAALAVTATAAVNTGATCTLPAAGAGLFHYITSIRLTKRYSAVGVASGSGVVVTTTNMPGNLAWDTEQLASPAGTVVTVLAEQPGWPIRSAVANTATTFVAPAQLQTVWRWAVTYYTGP